MRTISPSTPCGFIASMICLSRRSVDDSWSAGFRVQLKAVALSIIR
jgi:hypothetical protein